MNMEPRKVEIWETRMMQSMEKGSWEKEPRTQTGKIGKLVKGMKENWVVRKVEI